MNIDFAKKDYEISVYKNELSDQDYDNVPNGVNKIKYFKQNKIASIGSSNFKSMINAYSPKFNININGKKTLTFNMYYRFRNPESGEYEINPLIDLIHNDTLIELRMGDQYYDLIVTKVQKNSDNTVYNFTAEDAHIIELGKNGFNAELNVELENNMGTINELGARILENSDWKVSEDSDLIIQSLEDSLYLIEANGLTGFEKRTDYLPDAYYINEVDDYTQNGNVIEGTVYAFYDDIANKDKTEIGFLYLGRKEPKLNADGLIVNSYNYYMKKEDFIAQTDFDNKKLSILRGRRVVKSPLVFYDSDLKRTVNRYSGPDEKEYFGYAEANYITPILTENYISNPCNMTSIYDWSYANTDREREFTENRLLCEAMPEPEKAPYVSYLKIKGEAINQGIQGHRTNLGHLANGEKFVLAFLKRTSGYEIDITKTKNTNFKFKMGFYRYTDKNGCNVQVYKDSECSELGAFKFNGHEDYLRFYPTDEFEITDTLDKNKKKIYEYMILQYDGKTISDLTENLDNFIGAFFESAQDTEIYEVLFFKYEKFNGQMVYPGYVPKETKDLCKIYHNIYWKDAEESKFVARIEDGDFTNYTPLYQENCEKVSSVTGKESNYYTLLSNLTKTFECWMDPYVERINGKLVYKDFYYNDVTGQAVDFSEEQLYTTLENVGKFYSTEEGLALIEKEVTYKWKKQNAVEYKEGDYYLNGMRMPAKVVSQLEEFEKFYANGELKTDLRRYEVEGYYPNYLYVVNYEGIDTAYGESHPMQNFYTLELQAKAKLNTAPQISVIKKPSKIVRFRNYLNDTPNWTGFKYGINIRNIQRVEDASNFSTKVIVKNNNNEFAKNKMCSIARAENNLIKDNFIIDFGYYVRQGMLDKEELYKDLYENYYPRIAELNKRNENIIEEHVADSITLDHYQSEFESYYLAYNSAQENIAKYCKLVRNCGEKYAINLDDWHVGGLDPIKENTYALLVVDDYDDIKSSVNPEIFAGVDYTNEIQKWYDLKAIYYHISDKEFYSKGEDGVRNITSIDKGCYYYVIETNEESLAALNKKVNGNRKGMYYKELVPYHTYKYNKSGLLEEYHNKTDYYWNRGLYDYATKIDEDLMKCAIYGPMYRAAEANLLALKEKMSNNINISVDLVAQKNAILRQFFSKYSDFIRESSWNDDKYIDDELYYLDARDSLHAAAFPKISYTINVIDVSMLDGYECYNLKVGDYTFIEDTEFFGWENNGKPAKEWVVVTEADYDLDSPDKNTIKIQNYKTQLEDLFSRISASIQSLELNKGGYNRQISDSNAGLPEWIKTDEEKISSSNFNRQANTGWALYKDGKWFLGWNSRIDPNQ